jgi:hypothetical protein
MSNAQYYITRLHDLYRSPGVVWIVRSGRPWWDGDGATVRVTRNNTKGWWRKDLGKNGRRLQRRWEHNIEVYIRRATL